VNPTVNTETETRPFLAKVISLPNFSSVADAKLKNLITTNLNRSENYKPENQNPKEQTNSARKKEKKPGQQNTEPTTK
jgi:hypothetical protein